MTWPGIAGLCVALFLPLAAPQSGFFHGNVKNAAAIRQALRMEEVPAKSQAIRSWSGLDQGSAFLNGWSTGTQYTRHCPPFGMYRTYVYQKVQQKDDLIVKVFVADSSQAAREMLISELSVTSAPISLVLEGLTLSTDGPGDMLLTGAGNSKAARGSLMFGRDNIGVEIRCTDLGLDVLDMARQIDRQILAARSLTKQEFATALQPPQVQEIGPAVAGERFTLTVRGMAPGGEYEVVGVLADGTRGTCDIAKNAMSFKARRAGPTKVAIGIYEKTTLLSRWSLVDIAVNEAPGTPLAPPRSAPPAPAAPAPPATP